MLSTALCTGQLTARRYDVTSIKLTPKDQIHAGHYWLAPACQQLFNGMIQRHKVAQYQTKRKALLWLGNMGIMIITTTPVLVNICNNPPLLLTKRFIRKQLVKELHCHCFHLAWLEPYRRHVHIRMRSVRVFGVRYARIPIRCYRMRCKCTQQKGTAMALSHSTDWMNGWVVISAFHAIG